MAAADCTAEGKHCQKCRAYKPLSNFSKDRTKPGGHNPSCRECVKLKNAAYRAKNPDKFRAYRAARAKEPASVITARTARYRALNPDKVKLQHAAYREKNSEKLRVANAEWRKNNPEKARAASAKWRANNQEAVRLQSHARRARVRDGGGAISGGLIAALYALQKGKCPCCRQPLGDDFHLDHKMPLALGGSNTDDNMQLLRAKCNREKSAKHPVDFMQERGFLL